MGCHHVIQCTYFLLHVITTSKVDGFYIGLYCLFQELVSSTTHQSGCLRKQFYGLRKNTPGCYQPKGERNDSVTLIVSICVMQSFLFDISLIM